MGKIALILTILLCATLCITTLAGTSQLAKVSGIGALALVVIWAIYLMYQLTKPKS